MLTAPRLFALVASISALAASMVLGYSIGSASAPGEVEADEARDTAFAQAFAEVEGVAYGKALEEGSGRGDEDGRAEGRRSGAGEGEAAADAALDEARAQAASTAPSSPTDPYAYPLDAPPPDPVGTDCEPPFSYHMGGCRLARPALPEECPPGWVPAGVTGACGPGMRP